MKRFNIKSAAFGIIIGTLGITTAFAAVILDGISVPLNNPPIFVVKDNEQGARRCMPIRKLLEYLQFNVERNSTDDSVNFTEDNIDEAKITKNYYHNQAKKNMMSLLVQQMNGVLTNLSYQANIYESNGHQYSGQIYSINKKDNIEYVMKILETSQPIFVEINYEPTNIYVFVGSVNLGFAGGGDFYWFGENGKTYGFGLSATNTSELWEFLNSLEYKTFDENPNNDISSIKIYHSDKGHTKKENESPVLMIDDTTGIGLFAKLLNRELEVFI